MSNKVDRELEKSDNWDYERPEVREPVKAPRVVVSVAFRRNDFKQVSEYAERKGKKISEFIREAALEKATGQGVSAFAYGSGSIGTVWWLDQVPSITRVFASLVEEAKEDVVTTL